MIYILSKKNIKFLLIVTAILLSSFSVGYAYLSQNLEVEGTVTILPSATVVVSKVTATSLANSASESSNSSISGTSVSLGLTFPKTNSNAIYSITIKNNGTTSVRYSGVDATISNSAFTYTLTGIDTSTIIESGETVTVTLKITYTDDYKYTLPSSTSTSSTTSGTSSNFVFNFNFGSTTRAALQNLTGTISPSEGDVTATTLGAMFTVNITNPNDFPVSYTLSGEGNFNITDSNGNNVTYYLAANASDSYDIYIKDTDTSIAEGTSSSIKILTNVEDYEEVVSSVLGAVTLKLEEKNKYVVISGGGGIKVTPDEIDYSSSDSSSSGIYAASDGNGYTYYYRGSVSNNYFSFAGYTWRILRIDSSSNVRLILNDFIKDTSGSVVLKAFKSSYSASSQDSANTLAKLVNDKTDSSVNSPMYDSISSTDSTTLRGWYNTYLASYESYIVDSKFCFDTSGGNTTSSGTNTSVFYYGSYQRIGQDTKLYSPEFTCRESDVFTEKIGLLSSDEYVFAGGAYKSSNTSIFLNDFGSSNRWWTLSPAYYDSNQGKVGAFVVFADGSISDWIDQKTITNTSAIRPVITVDGNKKITGMGTSSDPYKFSE